MLFSLCVCVCGVSQVKCDQYWPSRGTETYGMIQVTMLDTVELATYSVRTFALYKVRGRLLHAQGQRVCLCVCLCVCVCVSAHRLRVSSHDVCVSEWLQ